VVVLDDEVGIAVPYFAVLVHVEDYVNLVFLSQLFQLLDGRAFPYTVFVANVLAEFLHV
jgi:hypothetical protein